MTDEVKEPDKSPLEVAREKKAAREDAKRRAAEAHELEFLDLEEKYEADLGPRGQAFEMVDSQFGIVVVRPVAAIVTKRFNERVAKLGDRPIPLQDALEYVGPALLHPSREDFVELCKRAEGLAYRCCLALQDLAGARQSDDLSKR